MRAGWWGAQHLPRCGFSSPCAFSEKRKCCVYMQDIGVLLNVLLCTLLCVQHLNLQVQPCWCKVCMGFRGIACDTKILVSFAALFATNVGNLMFSFTSHVVLSAAACLMLSKWSNTELVSSACPVPSSSTFCGQVQHYTLLAVGRGCCGFLSNCLITILRTVQSS